jgi:hypothetical protein
VTLVRPPIAAWRRLLPVSNVVGVRGVTGALPAWLLLLLLLVLVVFAVSIAPSAATSSVLMPPMNTARGVKPVRAAHRSATVNRTRSRSSTGR